MSATVRQDAEAESLIVLYRAINKEYFTSLQGPFTYGFKHDWVQVYLENAIVRPS